MYPVGLGSTGRNATTATEALRLMQLQQHQQQQTHHIGADGGVADLQQQFGLDPPAAPSSRPYATASHIRQEAPSQWHQQQIQVKTHHQQMQHAAGGHSTSPPSASAAAYSASYRDYNEDDDEVDDDSRLPALEASPECPPESLPLLGYKVRNVSSVIMDIECELCKDADLTKVYMRRRFNVSAGLTYHNIYRMCILAGFPLDEDDRYVVFGAVLTSPQDKKVDGILRAPRSPTSKLGTWLNFIRGADTVPQGIGFALPDARRWPGGRPLLCVASSPQKNGSWEIALRLRSCIELAGNAGRIKRMIPRCVGGDDGSAKISSYEPKPWNSTEQDRLNMEMFKTRFGANQSDNRRERAQGLGTGVIMEDEYLPVMRNNAVPHAPV